MSASKRDKSHFKPQTSGGHPRCQAFSKTRVGEQCLRPAKPGFPVCEYHGAGKGNRNGGRPPEPDAPNSKYNPDAKQYNGSKALLYDRDGVPQRLRARFSRLMNNPHIFQVDGELIVLQARLEERLEGLPDEVPMQAIVDSARAVQGSYTAMKDAMRSQDAAALQTAMRDTESALNALAAALAAAPDEREAWSDILGLMRHKSGLVDQARRHRVEAKTMIGIEEFADHHRWVQATVLRFVNDPVAKAEIARQFRIKAAEVFGLEATARQEPLPDATPPLQPQQMN